MAQSITRIAILVSIFLLFVFIIFVVNQSAQFIILIRSAYPWLGNVVLWILVAIYSTLVLMPVFLWITLPKQLKPPACAEGPEYARFLVLLGKRLCRNSRLAGLSLATHADIEAGLRLLDAEADSIISSAASTVFLSTAVSQSGRLDGLVVLVAQCRLVWQVATIYHQRPSVREFVHLYANVASTAMVAVDIDDVDLEGLLTTFFGSGVAAFPGLQLVAGSVLSGAANAFLTLRVGMIAKQYCNCLVLAKRKTIRRTATVQAAKLIGRIVKDGVTRLSARIATGPRKKAQQFAAWVVAQFESAAFLRD